MSKKQHWSLRPDDAQPLTRVKQCLGCAVRVSGSFRSCRTTGISTVQCWCQLLLLLFYWWYHSNESVWGIIPWVNWVNSQNITSLVEVNMKIKMQKVIKHCLECLIFGWFLKKQHFGAYAIQLECLHQRWYSDKPLVPVLFPHAGGEGGVLSLSYCTMSGYQVHATCCPVCKGKKSLNIKSQGSKAWLWWSDWNTLTCLCSLERNTKVDSVEALRCSPLSIKVRWPFLEHDHIWLSRPSVSSAAPFVSVPAWKMQGPDRTPSSCSTGAVRHSPFCWLTRAWCSGNQFHSCTAVWGVHSARDTLPVCKCRHFPNSLFWIFTADTSVHGKHTHARTHTRSLVPKDAWVHKILKHINK